MGAVELVVHAIAHAQVVYGKAIGVRIGRQLYDELNEDCRRKSGDPNTTFKLLTFQGLPLTVLEEPVDLLQVVAPLAAGKKKGGDGWKV